MDKFLNPPHLYLILYVHFEAKWFIAFIRSSKTTVSSKRLRTAKLGDFPGGTVVKTLRSQCRRLGFDPWSGNKIPLACRN